MEVEEAKCRDKDGEGISGGGNAGEKEAGGEGMHYSTVKKGRTNRCKGKVEQYKGVVVNHRKNGLIGGQQTKRKSRGRSAELGQKEGKIKEVEIVIMSDTEQEGPSTGLEKDEIDEDTQGDDEGSMTDELTSAADSESEAENEGDLEESNLGDEKERVRNEEVGKPESDIKQQLR